MEKKQPKKIRGAKGPKEKRNNRNAEKQSGKTHPSKDTASRKPSKSIDPENHPFKAFLEKQTKQNTKKAKLGEAPPSRASVRGPKPPSGQKRYPSKTAPVQRAPVKLDEPMRLNKYIAHCGISARRQAAEYVKEGLVRVNGTVESNPGYLVQPTDVVEFKGKPIKLEERKVYILMNKPKNVITTASDEKGRKTVLEIIGNKIPERLFPVGRLDRMTTGLLLLTNDGDLAKKLSHPKYKVAKFYQVTLDKTLRKDDLERIRKGLELEDGPAIVDGIDYVGGVKTEIGIELHMGKNRIIRRIFEHLGYEVLRLDRTYYAGLTKKDIGRGHFRHLTEQEVLMLKHFK